MPYKSFRRVIAENRSQPLSDGSKPLVPPIDVSVTYTLEDFAEYEDRLLRGGKQYVYASDGNPTTDRLEEIFARLHNAEQAIVTSSGAAAMAAALLGTLQAGSRAIVLLESYKSSRFFLEKVLSDYGVTVEVISLHHESKLHEALQKPDSRLLLLESPTNPMTYLVDLLELTRRARANNVLTVLDNTMAGPENHTNLGIDIFTYSLTKTLSGHGDVMGGVLVGSNNLLEPIRRKMKYFSPFLDSRSAQLILRGMQTYPIRMEYIQRSVTKLVEFLKHSPFVERVYYPGDSSHPHYHLFQNQMTTPGVVMTFTLRADDNQLRKFFDSLRTIKTGFSFGTVHSIASPALLFYGRELSEELRKQSGIEAGTVRLSVGLEDTETLQQDLESALLEAFSET